MNRTRVISPDPAVAVRSSLLSCMVIFCRAGLVSRKLTLATPLFSTTVMDGVKKPALTTYNGLVRGRIK